NQSPSDAPSDKPMFTFIDHDDDLTSKRIKDANARKVIRSHVMRDVRRRERLAGLKRTARRDGSSSRGGATTKSRIGKDDQSTVSTLVLRSASPSTTQSATSPANVKARRGSPTERCDQSSTSAASHVNSAQSSPNPESLPMSWSFAPFCTETGPSKLPYSIAYLTHHYINVFIPMTYPNVRMRKRSLERFSSSDPGNFYGMMCMSAAHRAVLSSARLGGMDVARSNYIANDPDYCLMRVKCIREMNLRLGDPKRALTDEAFDTIIHLLSGTLISGFYDEARIHLKGLKRMVDLRGGIRGDIMRSTLVWIAIIVTDIKTASGILAKPIFPLAWDLPLMSPDLHNRIQPPPLSTACQTGSGFFSNMMLSLPLLRALLMIRDLIWYHCAVQTTPEAFTGSDHQFFSTLNHTVEYQLLDYLYPDTSAIRESSPTPIELHPIESLTRVAALTFLNKFMIVSPPSSGLGRAVTRHCVNAAQACDLTFLEQMPKENCSLYAWAMFIAAQGLTGFPERQVFVQRLARIVNICEWCNWDQVPRIMCDYFYIPSLHDKEWRTIWDEATGDGEALVSHDS
ncbi:Fungal transcription factor, partial [Penicillium ucsense]